MYESMTLSIYNLNLPIVHPVNVFTDLIKHVNYIYNVILTSKETFNDVIDPLVSIN